jgi:tetratricopeptide (TPR) repeat protein
MVEQTKNQEPERKPKKAAFLIGGVLYGALLGFSALFVVSHRPDAEAHQPAARPQGPPPAAGAAGPAGAQGGGAPMMAQIGELRKRVEQNPQDRGALLQLGALYAQAGMWSDAGTFFEQAVGLTPQDRPLLVQLGDFHYDARQWSAGAEWYDRALRLDPDDPNVLTDQGFCLTQLGQPERALENFTRANEIDPQHWQSLYNIVVVAGIDMKRFEQAREALAKVEQINPGAEGLAELRHALEQAEAGAP